VAVAGPGFFKRFDAETFFKREYQDRRRRSPEKSMTCGRCDVPRMLLAEVGTQPGRTGPRENGCQTGQRCRGDDGREAHLRGIGFQPVRVSKGKPILVVRRSADRSTVVTEGLLFLLGRWCNWGEDPLNRLAKTQGGQGGQGGHCLGVPRWPPCSQLVAALHFSRGKTRISSCPMPVNELKIVATGPTEGGAVIHGSGTTSEVAR
jgi:hypothetical protein